MNRYILYVFIFFSCTNVEVRPGETAETEKTAKVFKLNSPGKKLFEENCRSCHHENRRAIGPPFQGIRKAYGKQWSVSFVKNNREMLMAEDIRAQYIALQYGMAIMPLFPNLDDHEIKQIFDYVDSFPILDARNYEHYNYSPERLRDSIKANWKY